MSVIKFLTDPPRFLFFTGKGGVGKTSIACASAITLARSGKKVLLVSTDPASNVAQVLGLTIGNTITAIPAVSGLSALEIDPDQAAEQYRERIIKPVVGLLPDHEIALMREQLSGSCTTEIASFNEFTDLLATSPSDSPFDHIVFDTAPTGHTIRLLQLPGSWTDFLTEAKGDASCLGPLSGLEKQKTTYASAVDALQDPKQTRLVLVTRPQKASLDEAARTWKELSAIHIVGQNLVINGVLPEQARKDYLAEAIATREQNAITHMDNQLSTLNIDLISLKSNNMVGLEALASMFEERVTSVSNSVLSSQFNFDSSSITADSKLIDDLEKDGHGLIMCMGKGGVGKTTVAAAIAVALAHRGHEVTLTTTDPAAHLSETLHGEVAGLVVSKIDPESATESYRENVMATRGAKLDEIGKAALWEDLQSPCTEEVAVFQQFSKAVHESRNKFVVIDTAPTGHTLLLLDAAGSYHREVARQMGDSKNFTTPLMRLQDPQATKVIVVTLAEPTPVMEAAELQTDLQRAGIEPYAWVINNSIAAAHPTNEFLKARAMNEIEQFTIVKGLASRVAVIPLLATEPVGEAALADLFVN